MDNKIVNYDNPITIDVKRINLTRTANSVLIEKICLFTDLLHSAEINMRATIYTDEDGIGNQPKVNKLRTDLCLLEDTGFNNIKELVAAHDLPCYNKKRLDFPLSDVVKNILFCTMHVTLDNVNAFWSYIIKIRTYMAHSFNDTEKLINLIETDDQYILNSVDDNTFMHYMKIILDKQDSMLISEKAKKEPRVLPNLLDLQKEIFECIDIFYQREEDKEALKMFLNRTKLFSSFYTYIKINKQK